MLDFSFAEIALIVVVAVVFIGPKDLPVVIRAIAKAMKAIRGLAGELRQAFDELSKESGIEDIAGKPRLIKGDDGKMYESYDLPFKDSTHDQ
jgi:sec-independent protein translocase protein TatB